MSLQHVSAWRRLAIAGLLATQTTGFDCDRAEARTAHHLLQTVRKAADKGVVHDPNYHPPYSAIVIGNNSEGRTAHHHPQAVRQTADKRVVHGPNYHPPYSAIVIDNNSEGRTAHHHPQAVRQTADKRVVHGPNYHPPYSAIVIDNNSSQVLHDENADEPRHPASLTKIMTLYLLFEQLEAGRLKLDTQLRVSALAALQPPTKLGLKVNQTLAVEDAIKGLVTESANDAAVVVAEAIAGSEAEFAKLMTQKARALGMMSTTYINASGLPADEQITTARDQALLGCTIQDRFPNYYRYFSTPSFRYHGVEMHNHNVLLGQVEGVDGVKTGYTEASGYNLVASVRRKERHIVAVVLGGTSRVKRDARMRELITRYIPLAVMGRTQSYVGTPRFEQAVQPGEVREGGVWKIRLLTVAPKAGPNAVTPGMEPITTAGAESNSASAGTANPGTKKTAILINIDKTKQKMTVLLDGVETFEWPVSTGRAGYSTPTGTYTATSMNEIWYSKQWDNAPMPHSIFFMKDGHAIHGSNEVKNLGKPVSHGCVRISPENAATLYALVAENGLENTQVVLTGVTPGGEFKFASRSRYGQASPGWGFFGGFFGGPYYNGPQAYYGSPWPIHAGEVRALARALCTAQSFFVLWARRSSGAG